MLGVLFLLIVVLFLFFASYYTYYVPANKATTNKYGFTILREIETALHNRVDAEVEVLAGEARKVVDSAWPKGVSNAMMIAHFRSIGAGSQGEPQPSNHQGRLTVKTSVHLAGKVDIRGVQGRLRDIANDKMWYVISYKADKPDSIEAGRSLSAVMDPLKNAFPGDFFSSFLLLKSDRYRCQTLYKNENMPIGMEVETDSLLTGSRGAFFPGVADLHNEGLDFKLFYIPITLGSHQFVLCGLKEASQYEQSLREVPTGFLYPMVIFFLLLLVVLPMIKLYIIGVGDKIKMVDLMGYLFALLAGSMLVTLIIFQLLLLDDSEERQESNLKSLSNQIMRSFQAELEKAGRQLATIDSIGKQRKLEKWSGDSNLRRYDVSRQLVAYMQTRRDSTEDFRNFDRVAWIDTAGQILASASLIKNDRSALDLDVSRRTYYTDFLNNNCFRLSRKDTALFTMQAVLSWADGKFHIMLAKRSRCPGIWLAALSTDLHSIDLPVLPSGFGFCLIDQYGQVQVHSEASRSLIEDFFEQTPDADQLKAAINGRQARYIPKTKLYGKESALRIDMMGGAPWYLVVYYDKGYVLPVNMRILIYSLLGCAISLLLCGLFWLLLTHNRWNSFPLLHGAMDYLKWMVPRCEYADGYLKGWVILIAYVVTLMIAAMLVHPYRPAVNHFFTVLLVLTPIFVGLLLLFVVREPRKPSPRETRYLWHYTRLVVSLTLTLGVMPATLFTWCAYNQEILQSVKREQLLKASSLDDRRQLMYQELRPIDVSIFPNDSLPWRGSRQGVYSFLDERWPRPLYDNSDSGCTVCEPEPSYEDWYFNVATHFSNNYYDPAFMPVLSDTAEDSLWVWTLTPDKKGLIFQYTPAPDVSGTTGNNVRMISLPPLIILTEIPDRFYYFKREPWVVVVLILLGIVLVGLVGFLVRRITTSVFLQKCVRREMESQHSGKPPPLVGDYARTLQMAGANAEELTTSIQAGISGPVYKTRTIWQLIKSWWASEPRRDTEERKMLDSLRDWSGYFAFVVSQCTPKEKLLLYNFARYGFVNYKSILEIEHLNEIGVLIVVEGEVRMFSADLRSWIRLNMHEDELEKGPLRESAWQRFRIPFLILFIAAAAFLFFTRQETWQRISALIAAVSTSVGLIGALLQGSRYNAAKAASMSDS